MTTCLAAGRFDGELLHVLEDGLLLVDENERGVAFEEVENLLGELLRRANCPGIDEFDDRAVVPLFDVPGDEVAQSLLLGRPLEKDGGGLEIALVERAADAFVRSVNAVVVQVGARVYDDMVCARFFAARVEPAQKLGVGPRLVARMRTVRVVPAVAFGAHNAVLVGRFGPGPLLELHHDERGLSRFGDAGEKHVDALRARRDLEFHRHRRVVGQRPVVKHVRHELQRTLPGTHFGFGGTASDPIPVGVADLVEDGVFARRADEARLGVLVDDHAARRDGWTRIGEVYLPSNRSVHVRRQTMHCLRQWRMLRYCSMRSSSSPTKISRNSVRCLFRAGRK